MARPAKVQKFIIRMQSRVIMYSSVFAMAIEPRLYRIARLHALVLHRWQPFWNRTNTIALQS